MCQNFISNLNVSDTGCFYSLWLSQIRPVLGKGVEFTHLGLLPARRTLCIPAEEAHRCAVVALTFFWLVKWLPPLRRRRGRRRTCCCVYAIIKRVGYRASFPMVIALASFQYCVSSFSTNTPYRLLDETESSQAWSRGHHFAGRVPRSAPLMSRAGPLDGQTPSGATLRLAFEAPPPPPQAQPSA